MTGFVSLIDEDSQFANVTDAASLVAQHGWTVAAASELTGAEPTAVRRRLKNNPRLPYVPTPDMIRAECDRIMAIPGRRLSKVMDGS